MFFETIAKFDSFQFICGTPTAHARLTTACTDIRIFKIFYFWISINLQEMYIYIICISLSFQVKWSGRRLIWAYSSTALVFIWNNTKIMKQMKRPPGSDLYLGWGLSDWTCGVLQLNQASKIISNPVQILYYYRLANCCRAKTHSAQLFS